MMKNSAAQAGEAQRATTTKIGVVHEHAVAKRCAHTPALKLIINHTRGPSEDFVRRGRNPDAASAWPFKATVKGPHDVVI